MTLGMDCGACKEMVKQAAAPAQIQMVVDFCWTSLNMLPKLLVLLVMLSIHGYFGCWMGFLLSPVTSDSMFFFCAMKE